MHIIKDWRNSWHERSHYKNDEYFKASIDYLHRKTRESINTLKVKCAKCHNPRLSVTDVGDDFKVISAIGLDKGGKVDKALKSKTISEGINCLVCHNINKINYDAPQDIRGMDRVEWNKNGIMSGPFSDAKSPYHKTQQRDFFTKNANQLCFVCHANDHSYVNKNLHFTNMQQEYKGNQKCIECHMGKKVKKYASNLPIDHGHPKVRMIRYHKFAGGHKEEMWKGALKLKAKTKANDIILSIINPQPHNIPSGFGSRELLLEISYYKGGKKVKVKNLSLTTHYKRKRSKPSTPHAAIKASKDLSIPAKGSKTFKISNSVGANKIKIKLYYRLVNDEVRSLLKLKDKIWSKKFFIDSITVKL